MYSHEPKNYKCPFCRLLKGVEDKYVLSKQKDIFYREKDITAFISSHWWPNNKGHAIIIPNKHIENIYSLSSQLSAKIHYFEKKVAIALKKEYRCDGVSSRQHNEPSGGQDVWHYHIHIFPRYKNDKLYLLTDTKKQLADINERKIFADRLKKYFK
ncbi:HIT family protein [Candidatus Parcubacteria bacterium]|nr:HIT family protein [Candidatus Parcubacteria bacterium]